MADITSDFEEALKKHEVHVRRSRRQRSHISDEFLKEAYRLVCSKTLNTHIETDWGTEGSPYIFSSHLSLLYTSVLPLYITTAPSNPLVQYQFVCL